MLVRLFWHHGRGREGGRARQRQRQRARNREIESMGVCMCVSVLVSLCVYLTLNPAFAFITRSHFFFGARTRVCSCTVGKQVKKTSTKNNVGGDAVFDEVLSFTKAADTISMKV